MHCGSLSFYPCIKAICIMQDVDVHHWQHWHNSPTFRSSPSIIHVHSNNPVTMQSMVDARPVHAQGSRYKEAKAVCIFFFIAFPQSTKIRSTNEVCVSLSNCLAANAPALTNTNESI